MDLISVHVPKTAGLSFKAMLMNVYGEERVYQDNADVPMNPTMRYHVDRAGWRAASDAEIRAIGPEFRAVHGHFAVEKYEHSFPEAPRIAWLRHPAAWVISLYYFWKHVETTTHPLVRRLHAGGLSIDEFARDPSARNRISSVFLKGTPPEAFAFLGIQEHFQDDCKDLYRMMGWPEADVLLVNRSPEPGYEDQRKALYDDDRLIDRLVALNEDDMALYEKGLQLRTRRLEQARILPIREQAAPDRHAGRVECA